ncbi:MAG: 3-deoxy-7-phosphoheptulonate synthase [Gammaproteobacteria bacterium]|nr:3-deoxy-7-phosphoheptulonate synthase [Gammaproteobacteria bacterium]
MILVMKDYVTKLDVDELVAKLAWMNLQAIPSEENARFYVAIVNGLDVHTETALFAVLPGVERVLPLTPKFKLAGREIKKERTVIDILGEIGLQYMQSAATQHDLLSVSEVMDTQDIDLVASYVDILQIGARNMQNFSLLKQVGKTGKPVLLKRGLSATYMDFLMAAEYILHTGNPNVILCERGIRTFETYARNTLDIAAVPILKELTHLPVIVDPSHGTGLRSIVPPMAYAAMGAGADGIMVEVHPDPDKAVSDAKQTITPQTFAQMMDMLNKIGQVVRVGT